MTNKSSGWPTPLTERLKEDRPFLTLFSIIPSVEVVEIAAHAGFDGVILDTEHGSYNSDALGPLILAARANGIYPVVRVRANQPELIGAALDAGCSGIIVPQVTNQKDAEGAIQAAKFAPLGTRGANPWVRGADFGAGPEWFERANNETAIILMIEGKGGIAAFDAIASLPGLDGLFVGPVDLSHSLGVPGQLDHPDVVDAIKRIVKKTSSAGLTTGLFTPTPSGAKFWIASGVKFVAVGVDTGHLKTAFSHIVIKAKES